MKKLLNLVITLLLPAALCLPACAQDYGAGPKEEAAAEIKPAAKPAAKKPAPKKKPAKKKKKKSVKPASQYKFTAVEAPPSYKFDKKANPIVKAPAKKKAAAKAGPYRQ
ncbi:MAG: hypothetical protein AAB359_08890 [Elusimicrobiota bacterium]